MSWENEWIRKIKHDSSAIKHRINKENLKKLSKEDLITVIAELVSQHCCSDGNCNTGALSADATAFAVLSIAGLMKIEKAYRRYARGKLADIWEDIIEKEADAK